MSSVPDFSLRTLDACVPVEHSLRGTLLDTLPEVVNWVPIAIGTKPAEEEHVLVGEVLPEVVDLVVVDGGEFG